MQACILAREHCTVVAMRLKCKRVPWHGCHNEVKMQACTLARQHCTVVAMRLKCKHVSFYIVLCIVCHVYNLLTITAKSSQNISYRHQNNHCQANNR